MRNAISASNRTRRRVRDRCTCLTVRVVTLLCTVRGCQQPLSRDERRFICPRKHSYDIARSGYVNLLQPQDRRSLHPGDTREAVLARRRFLERGLIEGPRPAALGPLLDVGCGEGFYLHQFANEEKHGIDISVPAIDLAAKKYRDCFFIVANADRFLPYAGGSFDVVTSITARMNPKEFHRVLKPGGRAMIVVPGPDDLIELREAVLGEAKQIERVERTVKDFEGLFTVEKREQVKTVAHLDRDAIHDVLFSSYRGLRTKQHERLSALADLDVTLSRDVISLRRS